MLQHPASLSTMEDEVDPFDLSTYTLFYDDYVITYQGSGKLIPAESRAETRSSGGHGSMTGGAADAGGHDESERASSCPSCAASHHTLPLEVRGVVQSITSWEVDRVSHEPVWPAAHLLCWFLCSDEGVRACRGKRILEVGAGVGLTGLTAAHFAR